MFRVGNSTDSVETGHDTSAATFFNSILEWLEVVFTDGLFISPSADTTTVGFLVIQSEMLDVGIDTMASSTSDDLSGDQTGLDAILRIIFEVTTGEWRSMGVHGWSIPTVVTIPHTFFTDEVTEVRSNLLVPGSG